MNTVMTLVTKLAAPYVVIGSYGTKQYCWNWDTAVQWLACTATEGYIMNRYTDRMLASRIVARF